MAQGGQVVDIKYDVGAQRFFVADDDDVPGGTIVQAKTDPLTGVIRKSAGGTQLDRFGQRVKNSVVATRAALPILNTFGTAKQFMSRSGYHALTDLSSFTLIYVNWAANGNAEAVGAQAATVKAAIEYPLGTIAAIVTFGGSQSGVMSAGGQIESDPITLSIPIMGRFAVRTFLDAPGGAPYFVDGPNAFSSAVDSCSFGTSVADVTSTTTAITNTQAGVNYRPALIKGVSSLQTVLLAGDSRIAGINDYASDGYGAVGEVARALSPTFATLNIGSPGATLSSFVAGGANWSKRMALVAGTADIAISNFGINDIVAGTSAATNAANYALLRGVLGVQVWQCTIPPKSTSSDSWATVANQTVDANNSIRVATNQYIRAGLQNIAGHIEIADYVESARDSGKWKADGTTANLYTKDGLHEEQFANKAIAESNAFRHLIGICSAAF